MTARRVLMWFEWFVGVALVCLGGYSIALGVLTGDRDLHHGGAYPIIFGIFLMIGAVPFAIGAWGLRRPGPSGWYNQVFPVGAVGWVLYDILSSPAFWQ